jgi:hypothetical protein
MEELLADSSDDDEFDDEDGKVKDKKGKKKGGAAGSAWIHEGGEGIVDLLSKDAAQRIVSTRPRAGGNANLTAMGPDVRKRKAAASEFKVGADGRLIITEDGGRRGGRDSEDDEDGEDGDERGPKGNR